MCGITGPAHPGLSHPAKSAGAFLGGPLRAYGGAWGACGPRQRPSHNRRLRSVCGWVACCGLLTAKAVTGARGGGVGRATLIKDLLEGMVPSLIEMARATELAKSKQIDALKVITDHLSAVTAQADQLNLDIKKTRRASMRKRQK